MKKYFLAGITSVIFVASTVFAFHHFEPGEKLTAENLNANFDELQKNIGQLQQKIQELENQQVIPKGTIVAWNPLPGDIPNGWAICNGEHGTPDLRNRFIVGAGQGSSYQPGATGGENKTKLNISQLPKHNHSIDKIYNAQTVDAQFWTHPNGGGGMGISLVQSKTNTAGEGDEIENRPPYYALLYIMKL